MNRSVSVAGLGHLKGVVTDASVTARMAFVDFLFECGWCGAECVL
ncbi:hypothetical protein QWJ26_17245 [Streptomyces sp. CSDS2]|nr:hypothetical protein [Streptomyces sp. CSDS2]MDN3261538.1 hypothetical protein [Streptomyces sp. CSDS2]